jgi:hypothetical protein
MTQLSNVRKYGLFVIAAIGAAATVDAPHVWAETYLHSGQFCQGTMAAERDLMHYGTVQARNDDAAGTIAFICPVAWTGDRTFDPSTVVVYYWDRNGNDLAGNSVDCVASVTTTGGSTSTSARQYSCSTAGGCASEDTDFVSASMQFLSWNAGFASGTYASWVVHCDIPEETGTGTSGISHYSVDQT